MPGPEHAVRLKKLTYRAWHRGMREADLILGPFAEQHLAGLSEAELDEFEELMEVPDTDLYAWIVGQKPTPAEQLTPLFERIRAFRFEARGAVSPERWGG